MSKYRIPVRVATPAVAPRTRIAETDSPDAAPAVGQAEETVLNAASSAAEAAMPPAAAHLGEMPETKVKDDTYRSSEQESWRQRALRLQAEMETYRRRQRRIAQEEARSEQVALLRDVLVVADNLDRTLAAANGQAREGSGLEPLTRGVELTRSALERVLSKQGLERMQAEGKPFDPNWHEAVHVVPATTFGVEPGIVVEVLEAGYRREGELFRPAKVVVAQ